MELRTAKVIAVEVPVQESQQAPAEFQPAALPSPQPTTTRSPPPIGSEGLLQELWRKKSYILKASALAAAFWLAQFVHQYFVLVPGELHGSLVRSFALAGATLIGVALAIGPLAVLKRDWNFIEYRRTFGVAGFTLVILHVASVTYFFKLGPSEILWDLNPFRNPLLFGVLAYPLFLLLYATSTDWAVAKLGFKHWKLLHRLVYAAYILSVLHFTQINPQLLYNPAGYLLLAVTAATLLLELAAFGIKVRSGKAGKGAWVGAGIIAVALVLLATAFFFKKAVAG